MTNNRYDNKTPAIAAGVYFVLKLSSQVRKKPPSVHAVQRPGGELG